MRQVFQQGVTELADQKHPLACYVYVPENAKVTVCSVDTWPEGAAVSINGGEKKNQNWKPGYNTITVAPDRLDTASVLVRMTLELPDFQDA